MTKPAVAGILSGSTFPAEGYAMFFKCLLPLISLIVGTVAKAQTFHLNELNYIGFQAQDLDGPSEDSLEGLKSVFSGEDFSSGIPLKLYNKVNRDRNLNQENRWRYFGYLPSPHFRPQPGGSVSLGESAFQRNSAWVVNGNCFACHAGVVAGTVISGVANAHIDEVAFKAMANDLIDKTSRPIPRIGLALLLNPNERAKLFQYTDYLKSIVVPSIQAQSRGENYGPFVIWRHIARLQNPAEGFATFTTGTRSSLESVLERPLPPVDPSPWWHFKLKQRAFWTKDVSRHSYATFALNLMDTDPSNTETFAARMERVRKQLEYVTTINSPIWPWPHLINRGVSEQGRKLFHGERILANGAKLPCAGCHGSYGSYDETSHQSAVLSFPEHAAVDWRFLQTDPAYASVLHNELKPLYEHFGKSQFTPQGEDVVTYPETIGYAPPPLTGIWASAPYFHNGSVPTVYGVLKSAARPTFWARSLDPWSYNKIELGLVFESGTQSEIATLRQLARNSNDPFSVESLRLRQFYSTEEYGRSNLGHTFGDGMNEEERNAVIEFLKGL